MGLFSSSSDDNFKIGDKVRVKYRRLVDRYKNDIRIYKENNMKTFY